MDNSGQWGGGKGKWWGRGGKANQFCQPQRAYKRKGERNAVIKTTIEHSYD